MTDYVSLSSFSHLQSAIDVHLPAGKPGMSLIGYGRVSSAIDRADKEAYTKIRRAWRKDISRNLKPKMKREVEQVFGGKKTLARSYAIKVYGGIPSMEFYSHAAPTEAHEYGAVITSKKGKYLAIPTGIAQKKRKGKGSRKKWGPRTFKNTFVIKGKNGLVIMQRGGEDGTKLTKSLTHVTPRGSKLYADEALPIFVLKRSVTLRKRTNIRGFANAHLNRIASVAANAVVEGW